VVAGTDDDLPPSHQNRSTRGGRVVGNGRSASGALPYPRGQNDMESQIHWLEQEAYSSVLRAFKAQSDAITWVLICVQLTDCCFGPLLPANIDIILVPDKIISCRRRKV